MIEHADNEQKFAAALDTRSAYILDFYTRAKKELGQAAWDAMEGDTVDEMVECLSTCDCGKLRQSQGDKVLQQRVSSGFKFCQEKTAETLVHADQKSYAKLSDKLLSQAAQIFLRAHCKKQLKPKLALKALRALQKRGAIQMTNSEGEHVRTALDGADRCHASASNWIAATPESRPAAAAEEPQQCWNKGCKAESSSLCVGCKKASYCSRKCQVRAWLSVASSICSWGCFQLTTALFTLLCF